MEHKLILGGAQYLPFARSRIQALRALGLSYTTQRFVLPDAIVRVQLVGDENYIEISGGLLPIGMDSGMVDLLSIAPANVSTYLAGTLYETTYVASYNTGFVQPPAGPPRLKPAADSVGQFSGTLSFEKRKFIGHVPTDINPAKSFKPGKIQAQGQPQGTLIDNPSDAALAQKKQVAVLCPASMFTGRCRLYVQALYGAHLYGTGQTANLPFQQDSAARPALRIDNRSNGKPSVLVSTGSGVYLDPATGKHWLFTFESGAMVYPLKSSSPIEALRKYLIVATSTLSVEDQEHLETYILSRSQPYGTGQALSGSASNPYSMGYGWHFNWDGLVADAVVNEKYLQSGVSYAMLSTWHRITISQLTPGNFNVVESIVSGPNTWSVDRTWWTITEPEWGSLQLVKSTPQLSLVDVGNATFYVFYQRNQIQTCEVRVTLNTGNVAGVVYVNASGGPMGNNCFTTGTNEGARLESSDGSTYLGAVFTCANYSTPDLPRGKVIDYPTTIEVRNKVFGAWIHGYGGGAYDNRPFYVSDDDGSNGRTVSVNGFLIDDRQNKSLTFDTSVSTKREVQYGQATVVVPLYDAEAVYLHSSIEKTTSVTANTTYHQSNDFSPLGGFLIRSITSPDLVISEFWGYAASAGAFPADYHSLVSIESVFPAPVVETTNNLQLLLCKAGEIGATFSNLGMFHDNTQDIVSSEFSTLSGTKIASDAVAIAPGFIVPVGTINVSAVSAPALVGWV